MKFGRGIVGAATVAVASAATHGVHHPNQRQFHERPGYGAQANFDAGDAFGVNANLNLGNPLADNQFFMPIIVGLGVLSVLNIATDVLGIAFGGGDNGKGNKGNGTDDGGDDDDGDDDDDCSRNNCALNITRHFLDRVLNSEGTENFMKILDRYASDDNLDFRSNDRTYNIGMDALAKAVTGMNFGGLAEALQQMNIPAAMTDGLKEIAKSIGQVTIPDSKYTTAEVTGIVEEMAKKNLFSKYTTEEMKDMITELSALKIDTSSSKYNTEELTAFFKGLKESFEGPAERAEPAGAQVPRK